MLPFLVGMSFYSDHSTKSDEEMWERLNVSVLNTQNITSLAQVLVARFRKPCLSSVISSHLRNKSSHLVILALRVLLFASLVVKVIVLLISPGLTPRLGGAR